jgi:hypothetical protein
MVNPIARAGTYSNAQDRTGAGTLQGLLRPFGRLAGRADAAKPRSIDTPRRRGSSAARQSTGKRVGGARAKSRARFRPANPRRAKPKGAASLRITNTDPPARDSRKGQSPETAARWAGPARLVGPGSPTGQTVCGCDRCGNAPATFREEEAPKGESQERRRCETKPAGARRE